jgi:hypothetical protein
MANALIAAMLCIGASLTISAILTAVASRSSSGVTMDCVTPRISFPSETACQAGLVHQEQSVPKLENGNNIASQRTAAKAIARKPVAEDLDKDAGVPVVQYVRLIEADTDLDGPASLQTTCSAGNVEVYLAASGPGSSHLQARTDCS